MTMTLVLEESIQEIFSEEKEVIGLKFKSTQGVVVFWGEFDGPNRNIVALRGQKLPMVIELDDPASCVPSDWEKEKGISWSVPFSETFYWINYF